MRELAGSGQRPMIARPPTNRPRSPSPKMSPRAKGPTEQSRRTSELVSKASELFVGQHHCPTEESPGLIPSGFARPAIIDVCPDSGFQAKMELPSHGLPTAGKESSARLKPP